MCCVMPTIVDCFSRSGHKFIVYAGLTDYGLVQFWLPSEFFFIKLFLNWTACSPITYKNPAQIGCAMQYRAMTLSLICVMNLLLTKALRTFERLES